MEPNLIFLLLTAILCGLGAANHNKTLLTFAVFFGFLTLLGLIRDCQKEIIKEIQEMKK